MNSTFTIKNFRAFDKDGVSIPVKPITILTGCNSSGKSSIVKSILLTRSFLMQIRQAYKNGLPIELHKYKLDFTSYPNNLLGRFNKVVRDAEYGKVTFEYSTYSLMLSQDVTVSLVFVADENDRLNNGYLDGISIRTNEGIIYSSNKAGGSYCNLNIIKDYCPDFAVIEYCVHALLNLMGAYEVYGTVNQEEYEEKKEELLSTIRQFDNQRIKDALKFVRFSDKRDTLVERCKVDANIIAWTIEHGSQFYIPVVEWLSDMPKAEVEDAVKDLMASANMDDQTSLAVAKVLDDFMSSEYPTFGEYFRSKESEFMEDLHIVDNFITCDKHRLPGILTSGQMKIMQNYIMDLHTSLTSSFSLDDGSQLSDEEVARENDERRKELMARPVSFGIMYEIMMLLNSAYTKDESIYYRHDRSMYEDSYSHGMWKLLTAFASDIVMDALMPDWGKSLSYVSSTRVDVKRLYGLDEQDDFTRTLQTYFEAKRNYENSKQSYSTKEYVADSFMNSWVQKFGLGEFVTLDCDEEGLGAQIRLHKSSGESRLLADEGYGITQLLSILIQIETMILSAKGEKVNSYYGLNLLDKYDEQQFHYEQQTIAVEEPEIHLHPRFQSMLADMFHEACTNYNVQFIIETHSEYLIRKSQVIVARLGYESNAEVDEKCPYQTIYVPKDKLPYSLGYRKDGKFKEQFGSGFYDEASNLAFDIL